MVNKKLSIWDQEPLNKIDLLKEYENTVEYRKKGSRKKFLNRLNKELNLSKDLIWNRICYLKKLRKTHKITKEENSSQTLFFIKGLNRYLTVTQIKKQRARIEKQKKKTPKFSILWQELDKEISKLEKSSLYKEAEKQVEGLNEEVDKFTQRQKDYTEKQLNISLKEKKSTSMNLTQHEVTDKRNVIKITSQVLFDKNGQNLEFKPFDLIDKQKLVKFCDEQLKIRKEKDLKGGMRIIHRALADILNTTEDAVSARYYEVKRQFGKVNKEVDKLEELTNTMNELKDAVIVLTTERNDLKIELDKTKTELLETRISEGRHIQQTNELSRLMEKLKRNPIVKFAYMISKLKGNK